MPVTGCMEPNRPEIGRSKYRRPNKDVAIPGRSATEWRYQNREATGKKRIPYMPLLNVSDPAPAISLPNQDGVPTTLEQYRGQHVILWWYPKADTPG